MNINGVYLGKGARTARLSQYRAEIHVLVMNELRHLSQWLYALRAGNPWNFESRVARDYVSSFVLSLLMGRLQRRDIGLSERDLNRMKWISRRIDDLTRVGEFDGERQRCSMRLWDTEFDCNLLQTRISSSCKSNNKTSPSKIAIFSFNRRACHERLACPLISRSYSDQWGISHTGLYYRLHFTPFTNEFTNEYVLRRNMLHIRFLAREKSLMSRIFFLMFFSEIPSMGEFENPRDSSPGCNRRLQVSITCCIYYTECLLLTRDDSRVISPIVHVPPSTTSHPRTRSRKEVNLNG